MKRYLVLIAVLAALLAGCRAERQTPTPSKSEPETVRFEVERGMRPFLDCTYAQYAVLTPEPGVYDEAAAEEACSTCAGLLEVYKAKLWAVTRDDDFGLKEAAILRNYAKEAIAAGSRKAR